MMRRAKRVWWTCAVAILLAGGGWASAATASLPDGRGYELVSPPAKNGADVNADSSRTRAAADGSAVSFASLGGFGDVRGTGVATEYMSERSTASNPGSNGWSTHAITPRQDPISLAGAFRGLEPVWEGEMSADLSKGVIRAWSPVTDEDPNVVQVVNDYQRDDLRAPGPGHYQLISLCPACSSPLSPLLGITRPPAFVSASADFSHVLFSSRIALTSNASNGSPNLYEWADGSLRLAAILPDSACGSPPCPAGGSDAGGLHAISTDGSRVIFTDVSTGQAYERIDSTQTVAITASERATPDPNGLQAASVLTSSLDGTRVFFTTSEELTNDDTNPVIDLYMWDANAPIGNRLTRLSVDMNAVDPPGDVQGVVGASDDGRYVYFGAAGQLVMDKPDLGGVDRGIYLWHEDAIPQVSYVGEMANVGSDATLDFLGGSQLGGGVQSRVSPDGIHLLFTSHSGVGLLAAHGGLDVDQAHCANGCAELYLYNADLDSLVCVSCHPGGAPPTSGASDVVRSGTGASTNTSHHGHPLSDDGRRVFFHTNEPLVTGDANGKSDVYEYDAETGATHLISGGTDPANSFFLDASADGRNVFFVTRQPLVGWDTDANYDLYDARVRGGFPDPSPLSPGCAGDVCRGSFSATPQVPLTSSTGGSGDGNFESTVKPKAKKCKRGFVRKKVRGKIKCVRKRAAKRANRAVKPKVAGIRRAAR